MNLAEKVVFITGAANGIGRSLAKLAYERGAAVVVVTDISIQKLEELTKDWDKERFLCLMLNVTSKEDWQRAIDATVSKFKKIDILCNVAGIIEPGYIHETTLDKIDRQIDINLKGTIYGTHLAAQQMVKNGGGHIVNLGSLASLAPVPGLNIYSASKFGVRGFTLAIAEELEPYNIHVSVICPDAVKTGMLDYQKDKKEAALTFSGNRYLTPEEVAETIVHKALEKKERDIWIPFSRGATALSSSVFPGLAHSLKNIFLKKGLKNQEKYG